MPMYNGIINVYKEPGFTSFDVVAKLRGIFKQKKIGHTGTLDPDAEGVLVVCLGKATKLCDVLTDKDKSYEATLLLGMTTDTEDSSGQILTQSEVLVTAEEIENAIMSFVGDYDQIPPMYSAIKVDGKKLYELARKGIEIERKPRPVSIYSIDILNINLPRVKFRVRCGKGTYIRSLCRDIGEKLGCGGIMDHLVRDQVNSTQTGKSFTKEDALSLDQIETFVKDDRINDYILNIDDMFPYLPKYIVTEEGDKKLNNGNFLKNKDMILLEEFEASQSLISDTECKKCLVYNKEKIFTAIYQYDEALHMWKVDKMFL